MNLTITLPLPPKSLSPNARSHWRVKAKSTAGYRVAAKMEACRHVLSKGHKSATVSIRWFTKTIRHPDRDNALASLKAAFDGVADTGYLANDRGLYHEPIEFQKDAKRPRVEMTFTPRSNLAMTHE